MTGVQTCALPISNAGTPVSSTTNSSSVSFDKTAPTVSSVSSTAPDGTYSIGQTVDVTVNFSETVLVTGSPRIQLETGTTDQYATYTNGNGTSALHFTYTIQMGDGSTDLDYKGTNSLELNTGTIKDSASNAATLTLASPGTAGSLGANKNIVIDTSFPTVSSVSSTTTNGSYSSGTIDITVNFSETVLVTGSPRIQLETGTTEIGRAHV